MTSSTSQPTFEPRDQSNTTISGKMPASGPKILDCCSLCDQGILTISCNVCFRDTHRRCADAFLKGTDKDLDNDLDNWRCPRCLTLLHMADPTICDKNKKKKKV
ncbi:hypothetical protein WA026_010835 [Henosepilachna vigintioctopunctata]|uniref:Zinc finger PHD-type domain-containing protein n=1 Tax=Henosepilachna vigintioctopunctata TaxID=420089 RepID=A0AAW1UWW6_9CUCU